MPDTDAGDTKDIGAGRLRAFVLTVVVLGLVSAFIAGPSVSLASADYAATVLADHPVSYWRLNDSSGPTAVDQVGLNPGQIAGATFSEPGPFAGSGSMRFEGNGDVNLGTDSSLRPPNNWTVEAWFKASASDTANCVNTYHGNGCALYAVHAFGLHLDLDPQGHISGAFDSTSTQGYSVESPGTYGNDTWHYAVLVRETAQLRLYIDGSEVAATAVAEPTTFYCCENIATIANDDACRCAPFTGWESEVAFYNYPLSAARIEAHYAAAAPPPPPNGGGGGTSPGGSGPGPPAPQDTVTLGPSVETVRPGGEVSLTAQVHSPSGAPVQGVKVSFLVTSGPDTGTSESNGSATNARGYTYFNYDTLSAGTDTVIANAANVPAPQSNAVQVHVSRSNPLQAVGLLTVEDRSGHQHSCTASVIAGSNQSTILTAAHCAWGERGYYSDFAFAPGFEGDASRCPRACKEPFGVWIGTRAYVDRRWMRSTDHAYDFAFIVMKTKAGVPIARIVGGGLSLGFHSDPRQRWTTYGYPGTPSLRNCSTGKAKTTSVGPGPENFSMPCNMNGDWHSIDMGASGGPWLTRRYEIGAVNSSGTECSTLPIPCTKELRGAQLQGAAQSLWATATSNYSTFTP